MSTLQATTVPATAPGFIRMRGRSFMALGLAPEPPWTEWLAALDDQLRRAPGFFDHRPVVLDAASVPSAEVPALVAALAARGVRLVGIEGADAATLDDGLRHLPLLTGGRGAAEIVPASPASPPEPAEPDALPSLLVDRPVRSGQAIVFPQGDVTVVGSVASGAEVTAGGSIHVYGTLRGRAVAGVAGRADSRIFCSRLDAELLAIDGLYRTADDIEPRLRGRAVQARLVGEALCVEPLD